MKNNERTKTTIQNLILTRANKHPDTPEKDRRNFTKLETSQLTNDINSTWKPEMTQEKGGGRGQVVVDRAIFLSPPD